MIAYQRWLTPAVAGLDHERGASQGHEGEEKAERPSFEDCLHD
jgi:hypothetical protein